MEPLGKIICARIKKKKRIRKSRSDCFLTDSSGGRYVRDLACATGVALLSWFVALVSVLIVALVVTLLGRSMFWYTHFYASICLYGAAATGKMILVHTLAKNLYFEVSELL